MNDEPTLRTITRMVERGVEEWVGLPKPRDRAAHLRSVTGTRRLDFPLQTHRRSSQCIATDHQSGPSLFALRMAEPVW
jgi:hypothetical protein